MAEEQRPLVRVLRFHQTFERIAVKGNPLTDEIDNRGFKLDDKGKRILETVEVDWVTYAPSHAPLTAATTDRVRHLRPTQEMLEADPSEKLKFMLARWAAIEPAYEAWKAGHELPLDGVPLGQWPGITGPMAEELRKYGVRTVEEVRDLTDGQIEKIRLPNMRDLRKMARAFLDNMAATAISEREVERDNEVAALKQQLQEQNEKFEAAMALLQQQQQGSEIDQLRAECDARGIKYHHRAGVDALRGLLTESAA